MKNNLTVKPISLLEWAKAIRDMNHVTYDTDIHTVDTLNRETKKVFGENIAFLNSLIPDLENDNQAFNEPDHYHTGTIDAIAYIRETYGHEGAMFFYGGNVIKYAGRFHKKNGREDIVKAIDYAQRMLAEWDHHHGDGTTE